MTTKPEERTRRHLDEHGGQTDASVRHVPATSGVDREVADGRRRIETSLSEAGVEVEPRLAGLADDAAGGGPSGGAAGPNPGARFPSRDRTHSHNALIGARSPGHARSGDEEAPPPAEFAGVASTPVDPTAPISAGLLPRADAELGVEAQRTSAPLTPPTLAGTASPVSSGDRARRRFGRLRRAWIAALAAVALGLIGGGGAVAYVKLADDSKETATGALVAGKHSLSPVVDRLTAAERMSDINGAGKDAAKRIPALERALTRAKAIDNDQVRGPVVEALGAELTILQALAGLADDKAPNTTSFEAVERTVGERRPRLSRARE